MWKRTALAAALGMSVSAAGASAETLRIGFISTFSGPASVIGKHQKDGWDLAVEHLGGKIGGLDTKIIYGDDQVKPDVGVTLANKLVNRDKVHFVAGVIWSHVLMAIQRRVTRAKVFLISTNAGATPMAGRFCNPYFFTTSWANDMNANSMGLLVRKEGIKNIVMIAPNYQAGKDNVAGFERGLRRKVTNKILTKLNQSDYQAELTKIRASKPDAVVAFLPGGMGIAFMKQWGASGLNKEIKLYNIFTVSNLTLPAIGKSAVGSFHTNYWGADLDNPANKKFVAAFQKKYGYMPSHFAAQAYDGPFLIDSAVKAVKGNLENHDGLRAALRKVDYASTRGPYRLNRNHIPILTFYKQEVVLGANDKPLIVTRGPVVKDLTDNYVGKCKMTW